MRGVAWLMGGLIGCAPGGAEADTIEAATAAPALDRLIEQFNAGAPEQDGVEIDAWTETGPEGSEIVVVVAPRGATKLVADPGITVTPTARPGLAWGTALPYRKVEPEVEYFTPPATLRLPFTSRDREPVELLVEYAWCVVDFQCFFGEETLKVALN
ncbi:MAG TPA: hypothetical protein VFY19_10405 [Geminicoccaceae bacterium]|nr:hypothetical protein [Geminicoccaceae bacterium]